MVLERDNDDSVSRCAALNPNCPPEALKMVLERGKNNFVSQNVALNPNCPLDIKFKWMKMTGKIQQPDPNKHYIIDIEMEWDKFLEFLNELTS